MLLFSDWFLSFDTVVQMWDLHQMLSNVCPAVNYCTLAWYSCPYAALAGQGCHHRPSLVDLPPGLGLGLGGTSGQTAPEM